MSSRILEPSGNRSRVIVGVNGALQRYSQSRRPHGSRPFHELTSTIPSFHRFNPEAVKWGNGLWGGSNWWLFWERPVTNSLFTNLPYGLPPYRTTSGGHSCRWLPLTANGHFSVLQELYQANQWSGREP